MAEASSQPFTSNDPTASYVNATCLELMLIELVPMVYRVSAEVLLRDDALADDLARQVAITHGSSSVVPRATQDVSLSTRAGSLSLSPSTAPPTQRTTTNVSTKLADGRILRGLRDANGEFVGGGVGSIGGRLGGVGEDELREATYRRLEAIGHRVGQGIAERFSRDHHRFQETLEIIKFICKDVWSIVFRKPVDNLKTNHKGVFVLTDKVFRPIRQISLDLLPTDTAKAHRELTHPEGTATPSGQNINSNPSFRFHEDTSSDIVALSENIESTFHSIAIDGDATVVAPIVPTVARPRSERQILSQTQAFLRFPAGVIRGALSAFGLPNVTVVAECTELPTAVFQVRVGTPTNDVRSSQPRAS